MKKVMFIERDGTYTEFKYAGGCISEPLGKASVSTVIVDWRGKGHDYNRVCSKDWIFIGYGRDDREDITWVFYRENDYEQRCKECGRKY